MNDFELVETKIKDITRASYYQDNKPIWIKLVAGKKNKSIWSSNGENRINKR